MEKLIKSANGQWTLAKANERGASVFTMDHVREIAATKDHDKAKSRAHAIVDSDKNIRQVNRAKIKNMIDSSKGSAHLASGMSNHILAHPGEGLKVINKEEDGLEKATPALSTGLIGGAIGTKIRNQMSKEDVSIAPSPSKPTKDRVGINEMAKEDGSEMMFSDLEQIAHHIAEIRASMKSSQDSPDWVKAQITEAAQNLSGVAHYIQGKKAKG